MDFPQSDGTTKKRPALVIMELPPFSDLLIVGISTQLHQEIAGLDLPLLEKDPGFRGTGLLRSSLVRVTMLGRIAKNAPTISRTIGRINNDQLKAVLERLAKLISG